MSSSSSCVIAEAPLSSRRRQLLLALAAWPLAVAASPAEDPTGGLRRWGSGEFRRFGFLIYEATLWAGDDPLRPPLALKLTYKRNLAGAAIAEASVKEIRNLGLADDATLKRWGEQMARLFPDVRNGDAIVGHYQPGGARFLYNDRLLGSIDEPAFARAFFAIWLDARTSAPELRAALLKGGGG
jgi:hypothetical protein